MQIYAFHSIPSHPEATWFISINQSINRILFQTANVHRNIIMIMIIIIIVIMVKLDIREEKKKEKL